MGNAVGVTLPHELLATYGLSVGDAVEVVGKPHHIEVAPQRSIRELLDAW
ncbi:MAG: AbrB/MazE/SpoVT family DNA-binding domain-containing protein [Chloroflexota bacterium]